MKYSHTHDSHYHIIPWEVQSQRWDSFKQHKSSTTCPSTRAMEQLPPLKYSPPVNSRVNIHLQKGKSFQPLTCLGKKTRPAHQVGEQKVGELMKCKCHPTTRTMKRGIPQRLTSDIEITMAVIALAINSGRKSIFTCACAVQAFEQIVFADD